MNKVRLYYIQHQGEDDLLKITSALTDDWLAALPEDKQASVQRLLHQRNRLSSLLGLRLLNMCAQDDGVSEFSLRDIQYPDSGKPCWQHENAFYDFNISHSGNIILIAASSTLTLGVDVEQIRKLDRLSFKMVLSEEELTVIQKTPDVFFTLWSKKEAVVKAADTSGVARMRDVSLRSDIAVLDEKYWHLKTLNLDDAYAVNLATSEAVDELVIKQVALSDIR